jgi:ATP-binding cassette subfamily C protein CydC
MNFYQFYNQLQKDFKSKLWLTSAFAAGVGASAVALLGLSGWFLTAAAVAGAAGPIAAQAFNYLLPSALIRFFAIARTACRYGERYLGHNVALRAMARLRPALFERMLSAPPEAALSLSRGEASSRFIQDIGAIETSLVAQSTPVGAFGGVAVAIGLAAWASGWSAIVLLLFFLAAAVTGLWLNRRSDDTTSEQAAMGALKARFFEVMTVLPDIRTYDLQAPLLAEFDALETNLKAAKVNDFHSDAVAQAVALALSGLCLVSLAAINIDGNLADLALALLATTAGFESLSPLIRASGQQKGFAAARHRVAEVFDLQAEPTEPQPPQFTYDRTYTLDRSLRLRLDGPSGSGKTQLVESLLGLRGGPTPERNLFAFCPQDAPILTGTIRDNLAMALDDVALKAPDLSAHLLTALDDAALKDRVTALPKGLDTWIGDGGVTLSGGERKRLALARTYLRNAPILVLDEPTEGLDPATEAFVVERLEHRLKTENQGLILISHRDAPRRLATDVLTV